VRVLWFTNDPLPAVRHHWGQGASASGGWMPSLLDNLVQTQAIHLDVVTADPRSSDEHFTHEGVDYFTIGQPRFQPFFSCTKRDLEKIGRPGARTGSRSDPRSRNGEVLWPPRRPRTRANAQRYLVQGLLRPILSRFFGALSPLDIWRSQRIIETATRRGLIWRYLDFYAASLREQEIPGRGEVIFWAARTGIALRSRALIRRQNTSM